MLRSSKITLLLSLSALIGSVSCTKPTKGPDDSGAFFTVFDIKGSGAIQNLAKGMRWQIPDSASYTFHACVKGTAAHEHVYQQKFTVEIPGSPQVYNVTTNDQSCFDWDETIKYNYFAGESGWVTLERDIVGTGVYTGKKRIHFAINPWAWGTGHRDNGIVVSLENGEHGLPMNLKLFPPAQAGQALSGQLQGPARLYAQNVKIDAIPEGEGSDFVSLHVTLELEPKFKALDAEGGTVYNKITDGQFDIMMQVMATNVGAGMNQKLLLLGGDNHTFGISRDGILTAEFTVRQNIRANQGNLELVINIKPRDLNAWTTLQPYNGVFRFGPGTALKDHKGTIKNECEETPENCEYGNVIQQAANYKDLEKNNNRSLTDPTDPDYGKNPVAGYAVKNERYIFSNLKLRFIQILPGETTTRRTVVYEAQTCITDNQSGKPLANTPLVVKYIKKNDGHFDAEPAIVPRTTDESGCLSWNGRAFHKYYEPEEFFEKEVEIQKGVSATTDKNGNVTLAGTPTFTRNLKFYLNPWDDKFTFGWDAREFTEDFFKNIQKRKKIRSRFFLSDYNYHTVRFLYNIDRYMELDVKKWVLMGLVPQVLRYSGIINARKMVEKLRDGIYLMKVAIQKSYLDPRDNSGWLLQNTPELQANLERRNGAELAQKEYITSNMVLVRVVDGVIIYPVELMMRDLRLMRVRSNMMIQLENVDERLIQAYHVFKQHGIEGEQLAQKLKDYQAKMPEGTIITDDKEINPDDLSPALKAAYDQRKIIARSEDATSARKELEASVDRIQERVKDYLQRLTNRYQGNASGLGVEIDSQGKPTGNPADLKGNLSINGFELDPAQLERINADLEAKLQVNDFSTVILPKKEEIDLNIFIEKDSGIEKRSFVGPVIFLSNAYGDSMRATDNLDEANCVPRGEDGKPAKDAIRKTVEEIEQDYDMAKELDTVETKLFNNRQNNAYQYSKYFNSLTHLCYQNVDDLMEREKEIRAQNLDRSKAASLKYNFIKNFGLDFVSLTNEPLLKLREGCKSDADACIESTAENTLNADELKPLVNDRLEQGVRLSNDNPENIFKRVRGIGFRSEKTSWSEAEYQDLFFKHSLDSKPALCNLMANRVARELRAKNLTGSGEMVIHEKIMDACSADGGLIHDIKLHVEQTGKYAFLGGLNLNFNVGEGFSVGTSRGWSAGAELSDIVGVGGSLMGGGLLKGAAVVLKPVNLKYGNGLSSSEGTNISESTYLVSQIAGFDVDLTAYEKCAWVGLSAQTIERMATTWGDSRFLRALGLSTANFSDPDVQSVFHRGLFICEGATRANNKPLTVPESYFYFTQHFTEGDMLDQADLYNHPWLFSLRGMRDFTTFVEKIRAQELVNLPEFLYHMTGTNDSRPKGWALEHLGEAYRNVTPSFPGFYTVLDRGEPKIDVFALQQAATKQGQSALSKTDKDPLREVNHPQLILNSSDRTKGPLR